MSRKNWDCTLLTRSANSDFLGWLSSILEHLFPFDLSLAWIKGWIRRRQMVTFADSSWKCVATRLPVWRKNCSNPRDPIQWYVKLQLVRVESTHRSAAGIAKWRFDFEIVRFRSSGRVIEAENYRLQQTIFQQSWITPNQLFKVHYQINY